MNNKKNDDLRKAVRQRYAGIIESETENESCCGQPASCCAPINIVTNETRVVNPGYADTEIESIPAGAALGLGCGNPQVFASLKPGETVLDLGSGGGIDCFLAAKQVGAGGHVTGVDMTPEMISRARANARKGDFTNVDFRLGEIEHLPVADQSVDVIISNCVINLSPEKKQVFSEAFRVLRPGGRLAVSDVVAIEELPGDITSDSDMYCSCVAGASRVKELEALLKAAGFEQVQIMIDPASRDFIQDWQPGSNIERYIASARIEAKKPV